MDVELRIKGNGRINIALTYLLTEETATFGRSFGADEPWPLPLTEKDFILQTLRYDGVKLERYQSKKNPDGTERIRASLTMDSTDKLADFFGWDLRSDINNRSGAFTLILPALNPEIDDKTKQFLESMFSDSQFVLRIRTPKKPKMVEGGELNGRTGVFTISLKELIFSPESQTWSISW